MNYIPLLILIAAVIHVTEEFFYPGGFIDFSRKTLARFNKSEMSNAIDNNMAVTVNSMFLLLCIINLFFGGSGTLLHYSLTGLILLNGLMHITASIVNKKYAPGLISSVFVYIPLSVYVFSSLNISGSELLLAIIIGLLLNSVPVVIVLIRANFIVRHH